MSNHLCIQATVSGRNNVRLLSLGDTRGPQAPDPGSPSLRLALFSCSYIANEVEYDTIEVLQEAKPTLRVKGGSCAFCKRASHEDGKHKAGSFGYLGINTPYALPVEQLLAATQHQTCS